MIKKVIGSYFTIYDISKDMNQRIQFKQYLENLIEVPTNKRDYPIKNSSDILRIQNIELNENIIELRILKLRSESIEKADANGNCDILVLEDGTKLAESASCLYDAQTGIFVLQRNIYALTPSRLESLLSSIFNANLAEDKQRILELRPIKSLEQAHQKIMGNVSFTKLELSMNVQHLKHIDNQSNFLYTFFKGIQESYLNSKVNITISTDARKSFRLNKRQLKKDVGQLYKDENVSKLKISYKENEHTAVETVDLLNDFLYDEYKIKIYDDEIINHDKVFPLMLNAYQKRANEDQFANLKVAEE